MSEQTTLQTDTKKKLAVNVIMDLGALKMCVLFPDTGTLACLPFDKWKHISGLNMKRKNSQPHYKVQLLIPEKNSFVTNTREETLERLKELVDIGDERKLRVLLNAIENLDGVKIPFNIIKHQITPLKEWIETHMEGK